jgi:hypothetical protein
MSLMSQLLLAGIVFNILLYAFLKYVDDGE